MAIGANSGFIAVLDTQRTRLVAQRSPVAAISPDGRLIAVSTKPGKVTLLNRSGQVTAELDVGRPSAVIAVSWSRKGDYLAAATLNGAFAAWDIRRRRLIWSSQLPSADGEIQWSTVRFSPRDNVLAYARFGTVRLIDLSTGREFPGVMACDCLVYSMVFDPAGGFLATTDARGVRLWQIRDAYTSRSVPSRLLPGERDGAPVALAVSADGTTLAWHDEPSETVTVWDIQTAGRTAQFYAGGAGSSDLALSLDGSEILMSSYGHTAALWRIGDDQKVASFGQPTQQRSGNAVAVSMTPDESLVAISLPTGVIVEDLSVRARTREACAMAGSTVASLVAAYPQLGPIGTECGVR